MEAKKLSNQILCLVSASSCDQSHCHLLQSEMKKKCPYILKLGIVIESHSVSSKEKKRPWNLVVKV